jgi:hypothetical protein
MSKRRTSGPQRTRASEAAMQRKLDSGGSGGSGRWVIWGLVGFVVLGLGAAGIAVLLSSSGTQAQIYPDAGREHITSGTAGSGYTSTPPTSGPHWDTPGPWGVYQTPMAPEQSIHNLEHGGIVIWYQPSQVTDSEVAALQAFTTEQNRGDRFKVILSAWQGNDFGHPIAVAAWRWLLYLDTPDTAAISGFMDTNYGQAPEPNGGPDRPGV